MPSFNAPFALARRAITCGVLRPRDPVPDSGRLRIVAVGQTPPPFGGQALTTQSFVTGEYKDLEIFHVRMAFSKEMADIGRPQARKLLHLVALIARVLWRRFRAGGTVLYYPPAGPALVPVLRDVAILLGTRWAFRSTVFHFNAAGLSEIWPQLPRLLRPLFRLAYGRPELAIKTSALNPPDGEFLGALRTVVVPNGVPELQVAGQRRPERSAPPVLLYIGVLSESKGLLVLADAARRLHERGVDFRLHLVGSFESPEFEERLRQAVTDRGLGARTEFLGIRTGEEQVACYRDADIFCFPTYFEAESFGRVVAEAMQFSLPVVATRWRGVPSVVEEGVSGLLVPVRDATALADAIQRLIEEPELAGEMGQRGREIYLERFTEQRFRARMERVLREVAPDAVRPAPTPRSGADSR